MEAITIRRALEAPVWDVNEDRDYLGMSGIGHCARKLYFDLVRGRKRPNLDKQKVFYEGYLHERDVVARFIQAGIPVMDVGKELVAPWSKQFRGHIDGVLVLDGTPTLLEVKSTQRARFERAMVEPLPEHRAQVQTYMHYGGWTSAIVVYKCRDDGDIWVHQVAYDPEAAGIFENKAKMILDAVEKRQPPACECGWCRR